MGREPDQELAADALTHARDRLVVLSDVHAVRARGDGQVGPVVQDEERAVLVAQGAKRRGRGEDLVVGASFSRSWRTSTPPASASRSACSPVLASVTK